VNVTQHIITIALIIFSGKKEPPKYVQFLGKALPGAIFGMLVIYCLKNVSVFTGSHGIPELIGIAVTVGLHLWKNKMLLSILGGTAVYMILIQSVF